MMAAGPLAPPQLQSQSQAEESEDQLQSSGSGNGNAGAVHSAGGSKNGDAAMDRAQVQVQAQAQSKQPIELLSSDEDDEDDEDELEERQHSASASAFASAAASPTRDSQAGESTTEQGQEGQARTPHPWQLLAHEQAQQALPHNWDSDSDSGSGSDGSQEADDDEEEEEVDELASDNDADDQAKREERKRQQQLRRERRKSKGKDKSKSKSKTPTSKFQRQLARMVEQRERELQEQQAQSQSQSQSQQGDQDGGTGTSTPGPVGSGSGNGGGLVPKIYLREQQIHYSERDPNSAFGVGLGLPPRPVSASSSSRTSTGPHTTGIPPFGAPISAVPGPVAGAGTAAAPHAASTLALGAAAGMPSVPRTPTHGGGGPLYGTSRLLQMQERASGLSGPSGAGASASGGAAAAAGGPSAMRPHSALARLGMLPSYAAQPQRVEQEQEQERGPPLVLSGAIGRWSISKRWRMTQQRGLDRAPALGYGGGHSHSHSHSRAHSRAHGHGGYGRGVHGTGRFMTARGRRHALEGEGGEGEEEEGGARNGVEASRLGDGEGIFLGLFDRPGAADGAGGAAQQQQEAGPLKSKGILEARRRAKIRAALEKRRRERQAALLKAKAKAKAKAKGKKKGKSAKAKGKERAREADAEKADADGARNDDETMRGGSVEEIDDGNDDNDDDNDDDDDEEDEEQQRRDDTEVIDLLGLSPSPRGSSAAPPSPSTTTRPGSRLVEVVNLIDDDDDDDDIEEQDFDDAQEDEHSPEDEHPAGGYSEDDAIDLADSQEGGSTTGGRQPSPADSDFHIVEGSSSAPRRKMPSHRQRKAEAAASSSKRAHADLGLEEVNEDGIAIVSVKRQHREMNTGDVVFVPAERHQAEARRKRLRQMQRELGVIEVDEDGRTRFVAGRADVIGGPPLPLTTATIEGDDDEISEHREPQMCIACMEDVDPLDGFVVPCEGSHFYCVDCLHSLVKQAIKDESLMPPRCCGTAPIPERLIRLVCANTREFRLFQDKKREYATNNRLYCANAKCRHFLGSAASFESATTSTGEAMHVRPAAGAAQLEIKKEPVNCPKCPQATCKACKAPWHRYTALCSGDSDQDVIDSLRGHGLQQCPNCQRVIERASGCEYIVSVASDPTFGACSHTSALACEDLRLQDCVLLPLRLALDGEPSPGQPHLRRSQRIPPPARRRGTAAATRTAHVPRLDGGGGGRRRCSSCCRSPRCSSAESTRAGRCWTWQRHLLGPGTGARCRCCCCCTPSGASRRRPDLLAEHERGHDEGHRPQEEHARRHLQPRELDRLCQVLWRTGAALRAVCKSRHRRHERIHRHRRRPHGVLELPCPRLRLLPQV